VVTGRPSNLCRRGRVRRSTIVLLYSDLLVEGADDEKGVDSLSLVGPKARVRARHHIDHNSQDKAIVVVTCCVPVCSGFGRAF